MIEIDNVSKAFQNQIALKGVSFQVEEGSIFGLTGTNGAGKSTLLRMASGVMKADSGSIKIDGEEIYENIKKKVDIFYLPDDQYFFEEANAKDMAEYYSILYPKYDLERFSLLMDKFQLEKNKKLRTMSKGMRRQVAFILGLCANTKYLFCDETFDGLDPVMRQGVKSLFAKEVAERQFTAVIASHNLRELEDICDSVGLLHKGGILLADDVETMKSDIHKIQYVTENERTPEEIFEGLTIVAKKKVGKMEIVTVRCDEETMIKRIRQEQTTFYEILPLNLEEIFISETGVMGYDIQDIIQ